MERTQIYLTEKERKTLKAMSARLGRSQSALIREAVDRYIERDQEGSRLDLLRQARGLWAKRYDLPDFEGIRRELDRIGSQSD
ncbi:MAG: ribbon-helix-helix domain-containing protein [Anaerolineae bacterium]|nr:MAG: ribbon-helix-helix domain-containing protein [Anaerolineae bacterium]